MLLRAVTLEVSFAGIHVAKIAPSVIAKQVSGQSAERYKVLADRTALLLYEEPRDVTVVAVWPCADDPSQFGGAAGLGDGNWLFPGLRS